jgi:hypothetical protein
MTGRLVLSLILDDLLLLNLLLLVRNTDRFYA